MSEEFTLEPYEPSHRDDYLSLLGAAWGGGAMGGETFDWWFDGDPAGSMRSVAVREGRVVGVAGHSKCRLMIRGEESVGQFSVHAVTRPKPAGSASFERSSSGTRTRAGNRARRACSRSRAPPRGHSFSSPSGGRRSTAGACGRGRCPWAGAVLRTTARFEDRHDDAYARAASRLRNHVVRDSRYLNWRYVDSPREYRLLGTESGGFAVVGFTRKRGLRLALLMDLVGRGEDRRELLRGALGEARGSAALLAVPSPVLPRSRLLRHGFLPTTYRLDFMGKELAEPLDARSEAWTVSFGDTDFF